MEPKESTQTSVDSKPFYDRPYEEEEDGYIDDRGFYTSPNGSFWDDDHNYFNHFGFDKHGGTYDKFGIYQPGPNYNTETGMYEDEDMKRQINNEEKINEEKIEGNKINGLKDKEKKDKRIVQKFAELIESEDESDDEEDANKSNLSFDINDIEEAYGYAMEVENNKNITSQHA